MKKKEKSRSKPSPSLGLTILRPSRLFRLCAEEEPPASADPARRGLLAASCLPVFLCLLFIFALGSGGQDEITARLLFILFVAVTWPAAAFAFWLSARIIGRRPAFETMLGAWGTSYWATDLFLFTLAATHFLPAAFSLRPADLPDWASALALAAYTCAALWKFLVALALLRDAIGARGWKSLLALAILLGLAFLFALLSGLAFGTKIPII